MVIEEVNVNNYKLSLIENEKAVGTIQKYITDIKEFIYWNNMEDIVKQKVIQYKESLIKSNLEKTTINSKLSAINGLFKFLNRNDLCVKLIKIQHKIFRNENKELTKKEYEKLVQTAYENKNERLALIIQVIGATGIRVSEIKYITMKSINEGKAEINLKGKDRVILIPKALRKKLQSYCKKNDILSGEIFITKNKTSLDRKQIWKEMKKLCTQSGIESSKVFPHNLRHLFALTFYNKTKDIVKLADVLGYSSINTTRIYLLSTGKEHLNLLDSLKMVC